MHQKDSAFYHKSFGLSRIKFDNNNAAFAHNNSIKRGIKNLELRSTTNNRLLAVFVFDSPSRKEILELLPALCH